MVHRFVACFLLLVSIGAAVGNNNTEATEQPLEEETPPPMIVCTQPGEVYNECGPACGDWTCDNQGRADIQCSKQCVEGCYCRNGYVRSMTTGYCIPPYRCARAA